MTFNTKGLMSSIKQDWKTPKEFYENLNKEHHFDFDPCPPNPTFDGLKVPWGKSNFVNPPYNQISKWIEKGYNEAKEGKTVVFLIPSRTDTRWWHEYVMKSKKIYFVKGRLRFSGHKNSAPFPSCVVVFKNE